MVPDERDFDADITFGTLCGQQESIATRQDLVSFIQALRADLQVHPEGWENTSLGAYLDALAAVTDSLDRQYENQGEPLPEQPTWKMIGAMLLGARIYE